MDYEYKISEQVELICTHTTNCSEGQKCPCFLF